VFLFNVLTSRVLGAVTEGEVVPWWRSADQLLLASMVGMTVTAPVVYVVPSMLGALVTTILFCVTVGVGIASLVSVLMREYLPLRGPIMGRNATGQNFGIVLGTGLATVGLSLGGYVGLAITVLVNSIVALGMLLVARRSLTSAPVASVIDEVAVAA
jgi:MFS family permease